MSKMSSPRRLRAGPSLTDLDGPTGPSGSWLSRYTGGYSQASDMGSPDSFRSPDDHGKLEVERYYQAHSAGPTALGNSFRDRIRPMLDVIDKLRNLGVMEEGVALPTIVVVGDQSSGKSSVLESLAGISLPRGQGIATRVPLILRLQASSDYEDDMISIEYKNHKSDIGEEEIEKAVVSAQNVLAGEGKGISDTPISLHIRKRNAPDLTMVDLPGITRVPVHGQPEDIYEQIATVIRHYISPPETVILNVLSATVDFPTCESIRMSQQADKRGERTLAVVTKVDKCPEGLCEKVTTDAVSIGLGYICVRNRVSQDESHEEARETERKLFQCHPLLSKLDKRIVGIDALAERLTHIQAESIRRCLPNITTQLERELLHKKQHIAALPRGLSDPAEAAMVFFKVVNGKTKMIERLIVHGDFANYQEAKEMHYTARLDDLFSKFATLLENQGSDVMDNIELHQVVKLMSEAKGVGLPNFLPQSVFHVLICNQIQQVSTSCSRLVEEAHKYAEEVQSQVISNFTDGYSKLRSSCTFAARNVLSRSRDRCIDFVDRILEKEQTILFTKNRMYMRTVELLSTTGKTGTLTAIADGNADLKGDGDKNPSPEDEKSSNDQKHSIWEPLYGQSQPAATNSTSPEQHSLDPEKDAHREDELKAARSMKVNLTAYWRVVRNRMADIIPQEIRFSLQKAMLEEVDADLMRQLSTLNFNMAEIMIENPALAQKRHRLNNSIKVLENAVQEVSEMMEKSAIPLL